MPGALTKDLSYTLSPRFAARPANAVHWLSTNAVLCRSVCLILFAYRAVPHRPLVLAANRDEFHARPALAAQWWGDAPNIYGGRDVRAQGTWLAVGRDRRLAAVTNWTDKDVSAAPPKSRGDLPRAFLEGGLTPQAFAETINDGDYAGFNFLAYDGETLAYASNRTGERRILAPGVYGLTNTRLADRVGAGGACSQLGAWPKATLGALALRRIAADATLDDLLALLAQPLLPPNNATPDESVDGERSGPERSRSPAFIRGAEYGTRASTAIIFEGDEVCFAERQYGPLGQPGRRSEATIALSPSAPPAPSANLKETA